MYVRNKATTNNSNSKQALIPSVLAPLTADNSLALKLSSAHIFASKEHSRHSEYSLREELLKWTDLDLYSEISQLALSFGYSINCTGS